MAEPYTVFALVKCYCRYFKTLLLSATFMNTYGRWVNPSILIAFIELLTHGSYQSPL